MACRACAPLCLRPDYLGPGLLSGAITGLVPGFYSKPCLFPDLEIIRGKCAWSGLLCVNACWLLLSFYWACPFYFAYELLRWPATVLLHSRLSRLLLSFLWCLLKSPNAPGRRGKEYSSELL